MGKYLDTPAPTSRYWPSPQQTLLLRAALMPGEAAQTAWRTWRSSADLDQLDHGSFRLLPLLYHNLQQLGIEDPWMNKLKGIYRQTWLKNQLVMQQLSELLHELHTAGMPTLLLKGAPLALLYYRELGLRQINDPDLLVPFGQVLPTVNFLAAHGWRPKYPHPHLFTPPYLQVYHAHRFVNQTGVAFNLHWSIAASADPSTADADLWQAAVPVQINQSTAQTLNPTTMLLQIGAQVMQFSSADASLQWIPDMLLILRNSANLIQWEQLMQQMQRRALTWRLQQILDYLRLTFDAPIPLPVWQKMARLPVQRFEQVEFAQFNRSVGGWATFRAIWAGYHRYRWLGEQSATSATGLTLAQYFQLVFQVEHPWQVPFHVAKAAFRRLSNYRPLLEQA
ncbi:MAG: nucleotidyltransferase family protein [Chloroflexi bacterium]|nr:nucleotidyltransferase family protein [Chloroflexota bacterium]